MAGTHIHIYTPPPETIPFPAPAPKVNDADFLPPGAPSFEAGAPMAAPLRRRPLRDRIRERLVDAAAEKGADRATAERVVAELASERPLLDWLLNGGWEKLLALILKLIDLAA